MVNHQVKRDHAIAEAIDWALLSLQMAERGCLLGAFECWQTSKTFDGYAAAHQRILIRGC